MARKRVTLEDVARQAGVSTMTVSRVINNTGRISQATRDRVREIILQLDYRPSRAARTLVTNKTFMVGLVLPDITNPYFAEVVQGVEHVAWQRDYSVLLVNTDENLAREQAALSQIEETTVDGIIVCASRLPDYVLLPLIEKHQCVVAVNRQIPHHLASVVRSRYAQGHRALRAAELLIELGRQRIGYIRLARSAIAVEADEFVRAVQARGIPSSPEWCVTCPPNWQAGYEAGRALLTSHPELDAVIGGNDLVALGAMRAAIELGRNIPGDLAVVGGDDILMASQVTPALTTFRSPKREIGTIAAQLLFKRIDGDTDYYEHLYDEMLVRRESTG
jgi:LacI family transcriptional regulator